MVLEKILGGGLGAEPQEEDIDIEDYLNDLSIRDGKIIESEDVTYVKSIDLTSCHNDGREEESFILILDKDKRSSCKFVLIPLPSKNKASSLYKFEIWFNLFINLLTLHS